MLINEEKLSLISSKYILKHILYHINYNRLLKLFKNNKSIQNKIGITLDNYKLQFNFPEYHYVRVFSKSLSDYMRPVLYEHLEYLQCEKILKFFLLILLTVGYFIYVLVYTLLLITKETFNDTTAQGDYKNKAKTINVINRCNFILIAANIVCVIILSLCIYISDLENCIIDINTGFIIILIILISIISKKYKML